MGITNLHDYTARVEEAVRKDLSGAQVIALVPNDRDNIERPHYWERSFVVVWKRELRLSQPDHTGDGFTYATHRVHINSGGEAACYDGNYDQKRDAAIFDMLSRAHFEVPNDPENDSALALWFTPDAIRQHFEGDDDELAEWVENASDDALVLVGSACLEADGLYREFRELLKFEVQWQIDNPNGTDDEEVKQDA